MSTSKLISSLLFIFCFVGSEAYQKSSRYPRFCAIFQAVRIFLITVYTGVCEYIQRDSTEAVLAFLD